ncbi:hypothetical protein ABI59_16020 [Acidobacteria bacterium Mor1]|nr:hypothetical protein ABI59_16020 [Acidobacteria bacterium Mor1]
MVVELVSSTPLYPASAYPRWPPRYQPASSARRPAPGSSRVVRTRVQVRRFMAWSFSATSFVAVDDGQTHGNAGFPHPEVEKLS